MTKGISTELNDLKKAIDNLSKKIDELMDIKHVSEKVDSISAIQDISKKIDENIKAIDSKIDNLPKTMVNTCSFKPKWLLISFGLTMVIIPLSFAGILFSKLFKEGKEFTGHETWLLCTFFVLFCTCAVIIIRTLAKRNE